MIVGGRPGGNDNVATFSATAARGLLKGPGQRVPADSRRYPAGGRGIQYAAAASITTQDGSIASIRMPNDLPGQRERLASTMGTP
jgi:hypothetical protein